LDNLKTIYSGRKMSVDAGMLAILKAWRQTTQFSSDQDWFFCLSDKTRRSFLTAAIGKLGTHSMRHTYRSWLDAAGTTVAVQQS
jgi:integrase